MGTFLTYAEQAIKSYYHSWAEALRNVSSKNPIRRTNGRWRLAGVISTMAIPMILQKVSKQLMGVSDDEDNHFRSLLPPWEKNNWLIYGGKDGETRTYFNTLYSSNQADISRAIHALLAPNPLGTIGKIKDAGWEIFRPLFNMGLVAGTGVNLLRNQTEYGTQVYNPADHPINQAGDILGSIVSKEFGPLTRIATRVAPAMVRGKVTPGGLVYNPWTGIAPEAGIPVRQISFPERFNSELYSSKDSLEQAQRIFTSPIQRSMNELTDDDMSSLYQRSEDARRIVFDELHQKVQAARFGGMTDREIKTALKIRRYSNTQIDDLMTGRYHPYIPSGGVIDNARKNGNLVPPHLFSKHGIILEEPEEE
jgi:hypothetical protein